MFRNMSSNKYEQVFHCFISIRADCIPDMSVSMKLGEFNLLSFDEYIRLYIQVICTFPTCITLTKLTAGLRVSTVVQKRVQHAGY